MISCLRYEIVKSMKGFGLILILVSVLIFIILILTSYSVLYKPFGVGDSKGVTGSQAIEQAREAQKLIEDRNNAAKQSLETSN